MVTRIRIEASGATAAQVETVLMTAAARIVSALRGEDREPLIGPITPRWGEQVITRVMDEPEGSAFAFQGRLILHPDISGGDTMSAEP